MGRVLPQLQATDIAVGSGYVCALDASGVTYCHATFGAPPPESYVTPVGLPPLRAISGAGSTFCGIAIADGTPWCWSHAGMTPIQVSSSLQLSSISAGTSRACGLTATGAAWCWDAPAVGSPVEVAGGHSFRTISARYSMCAIEPPTTLYCWDELLDKPQAKPGVSATQVAIGVYNENLVNTSSGATVFYLYSYLSSGVVLEPSSALPLPYRSVADRCALTFDGAVYSASP